MLRFSNNHASYIQIYATTISCCVNVKFVFMKQVILILLVLVVTTFVASVHDLISFY